MRDGGREEGRGQTRSPLQSASGLRVSGAVSSVECVDAVQSIGAFSNSVIATRIGMMITCVWVERSVRSLSPDCIPGQRERGME